MEPPTSHKPVSSSGTCTTAESVAGKGCRLSTVAFRLTLPDPDHTVLVQQPLTCKVLFLADDFSPAVLAVSPPPGLLLIGPLSGRPRSTHIRQRNPLFRQGLNSLLRRWLRRLTPPSPASFHRTILPVLVRQESSISLIAHSLPSRVKIGGFTPKEWLNCKRH